MPNPESPWAVVCPEHNLQYLTRKDYDFQMSRPDSLWKCPQCGRDSWWSDENYEKYMEEI